MTALTESDVVPRQDDRAASHIEPPHEQTDTRSYVELLARIAALLDGQRSPGPRELAARIAWFEARAAR